MWEMLSGDTPHKDLEPAAMLFKAANGQLDNLPLELWFGDVYKLLLKSKLKSFIILLSYVFIYLLCKRYCECYSLLTEIKLRRTSK